jgi:hypothetical protein
MHFLQTKCDIFFYVCYCNLLIKKLDSERSEISILRSKIRDGFLKFFQKTVDDERQRNIYFCFTKIRDGFLKFFQKTVDNRK